jgi:hypothetical protein
MDTPLPPEVARAQERERREAERKERVGKILELVERINESGETLPFPGIQQDYYHSIQEDQKEYEPGSFGYTTPIDQILERCKQEGIKIVLGPHPESGNVFVLPAESDDIDMDSLLPYHLDATGVDNDDLRALIELTAKKSKR